MAVFGWRARVCTLTSLLITYVLVSALVSISQISTNSVTTNNNFAKESLIMAAPPRMRSLAGLSRGPRITPRRLRSRQGPKIQWCLPKLRLKASPGPMTALASYPGSGNTWLRYLLQQATGYLTGSVYKDFALLRNGFPGESIVNGSVLAVKTHEFGPANIQRFDRAILLVRDPFACILAEFNRISGGHVGHAPVVKFTRNKGESWRTFVMSRAKEWIRMNLEWYNHFKDQDRIVVMYEDLIQQPRHELKRVLDFLHMEASPEVLNCTLTRKEGIYKRAKKPLSFDIFSPELTQTLERTKRQLYKALGLPSPPNQKLPTLAPRAGIRIR